MGPGATYAVVTMSAGVLCLLGWLYATAGNRHSVAILKKSLWLIVLPILFTPAPLFTFPLGLWAIVAFEEGVKTFASTREQEPGNKFWLVSLFGVWELTLDKPVYGLAIAQSAGSWDRLAIIALVLGAMIPVLPHAVTAAIYAFWFESQLGVAFVTSWVIHTAYNESVYYLGVYPTVQLAQVAILTILLAALLRRRPPAEYTKAQ